MNNAQLWKKEGNCGIFKFYLFVECFSELLDAELSMYRVLEYVTVKILARLFLVSFRRCVK